MDKSFVSFKYSLQQQTSCYGNRNLTQSDFLLIWSNIGDDSPFLNLDNLKVDSDIEHEYADERYQSWNNYFLLQGLEE